MRLLLFFDLPIKTPIQRKRYAQFRNFLIKDGFLMVQKSVYAKLAINEASVAGIVARVKKHKPEEGLIQVLRVTEKQFACMESIAGKQIEHTEIDSDESLLVL
ncbi:CRISPR-associated endonuclease Cas2 [Collinsella sp. zg1085]|uniref:CRISPR-associated endonuclease Cas2 n=1 Tax=Collinsella sp. zg1085 TaxID=2844380 RepID=UPI00209B3978|nr:CRISPR-associated endonuclease Cas2 [Collinsella sp. zg1085]